VHVYKAEKIIGSEHPRGLYIYIYPYRCYLMDATFSKDAKFFTQKTTERYLMKVANGATLNLLCKLYLLISLYRPGTLYYGILRYFVSQQYIMTFGGKSINEFSAMKKRLTHEKEKAAKCIYTK